MGAYEEWQAKAGPPWTQREVSEKIERACGAEKDEQLDRARQAMLAGLPGQGPADGLTVTGRERQLPRVTGESDDDYAERLRTAWDALGGWSYAGSHGSLLRALVRAGFPSGTPDGAHVIQRTKRYTYLSGGSVVYATHAGWTFDWRGTPFWNQFGIVFGADVAGLDEGSASAQTLNDIVTLWKPAKARFMGTWVIETTPLIWGGWPPGSDLWGDVGLEWGSGVSRFVPPP